MTAIIASNTQHEDTYISFYSHFSKSIREKSSVETELIKTSSYKQEHPYLKNERLPKVADNLQASDIKTSRLSIRERTVAAWFFRGRLLNKFRGYILEMVCNWKNNTNEDASAKKVQKLEFKHKMYSREKSKVDIFNISRYTVKGQSERAYLRRAIRDAIRDLLV